jgi:hypothetical protein
MFEVHRGENHTHSTACIPSQELIRFMAEVLEENPNRIVVKNPDKSRMNLKQF